MRKLLLAIFATCLFSNPVHGMWLKRALGFAKPKPVSLASRVRMPQNGALSFNAFKSSNV